MKRSLGLLLALLCATMTGCVSISYDPNTGVIEYNRWGDQSLNVEYTKSPDGVESFKFTQDAQAQALTEAMKTINGMAELLPGK